MGTNADKLIWYRSNLCIQTCVKSPRLGRIAWISTLYCISSRHAVITMPVKAALSFSFQCVLIVEWQVKKPHTVVGILIPVCLSHGKQFQMGPALCYYNTASALWHGKNALSLSGSEWKSHWRTARAAPNMRLRLWPWHRTAGGGQLTCIFSGTVSLWIRRTSKKIKHRCTTMTVWF